jgi:hypothetical protein
MGYLSEFFNMLYNDKAIDRSIMFIKRSNTNERELTFGDYPSEIKNILPNITFCDIQNNDNSINRYICEGKAITTTNSDNIYNLKFDIIYDIYAPSKITFNESTMIEYINKVYLQDEIYCNILEKSLDCRNDTNITNLPSLGIIVNSNIYYIRPEIIFKLENEKIKSIMNFDLSSKRNIIVLGFEFFQNYDLVMDMMKRRVTAVGDHMIINYSEIISMPCGFSNGGCELIIWIFIAVLFVIVVIGCVIIKMNKKHHLDNFMPLINDMST